MKNHEKVANIITSVTAIISLIIASISLVYSIRVNEKNMELNRTLNKQQIDLQINHKKMEVRPRIISKTVIGPHEERIGLLIKNNGLGPAVIKNPKLYFKGKLLEKGHGENQRTIIAGVGSNPSEIGFGFLKHDFVLPSGEEKWLFFNGGTNNQSVGNKLKKLLYHTAIRGEYCSLYEECFPLKLGLVTRK